MSAPCPEYRGACRAPGGRTSRRGAAGGRCRGRPICRPPGDGPADAAQGGVAGALGAYQQANWMTGYDPGRPFHLFTTLPESSRPVSLALWARSRHNTFTDRPLTARQKSLWTWRIGAVGSCCSLPCRVTFAGLQRSHRSSASPPPVISSRQRSDRRYLPSLYALPPLLTSRCPSRRGSRPATLNNATVNPVQDPARCLSVEWTQLQTTGSPQRRARSVDR